MNTKPRLTGIFRWYKFNFQSKSFKKTEPIEKLKVQRFVVSFYLQGRLKLTASYPLSDFYLPPQSHILKLDNESEIMTHRQPMCFLTHLQQLLSSVLYLLLCNGHTHVNTKQLGASQNIFSCLFAARCHVYRGDRLYRCYIWLGRIFTF